MSGSTEGATKPDPQRPNPQRPDPQRPNPWDLGERQGLQRINVKLFVEPAAGIDLDALSDRLLMVFGRWRLEEGEEVIDLADYAHVPDGPGVMLISHRWQFTVDWERGRPGLWISTRKRLEGTTRERIAQAVQILLEKSIRLLAEKEIAGTLRPRCGSLEITINDRLACPNTEEGDAEIRPEVDAVLADLYPDATCSVERESDPKRRLAYAVEAPRQEEVSLDTLLGRLG